MISKFKVLATVVTAVFAMFFMCSGLAAPYTAAQTTSLTSRPLTPRWAGYDPWQGGSAGGWANTPSTSSSTAPRDTSGLVLINTVVDFGTAQAAGTGMVIDSDGIVVTNHHVVAGSTDVTVTDPATDQTYTAEVLGYDATTDVAVLQLNGASDMATVTADTDPVAVGQTITAVGNAGGGGELVSSTGQVTATSQNITVTGDDGTSAALTDLIVVNASMVPGDSGGALLDSDSEVVGMNVAGSTDTRVSSAYAIPISSVLEVADAVLAGTPTDTVSLGRTAAIGVQVSMQTTRTGVGGRTGSQTGVTIVGVIAGGPADLAGMTGGSTITSIDGQSIVSSADLSSILSAHQSGDRVSVTWTDIAGASHTATLVLTQAPLA